MGCDIHALIERRSPHRWLNSGDPDIGRNYEIFAVLAGVRNYEGITPIAEPRGLPAFKGWERFSDGEAWLSFNSYEEQPCREMVQMAERYGEDGHSASWLTLAEIKAFDTDQTVDDPHVVTSKDETGRVTSMARGVWSGGRDVTAEMERVGTRRILTWPGEEQPESWLRLIRYMEQAKWDGQADDEIRLVFFFDN